MMRRLFRFKNDVAAHLVNPGIVSTFAKVLHQMFATKIARQLHATASTSSPTSRSRIEAGSAVSK
jgi:hypothetical protein